MGRKGGVRCEVLVNIREVYIFLGLNIRYFVFGLCFRMFVVYLGFRVWRCENGI